MNRKIIRVVLLCLILLPAGCVSFQNRHEGSPEGKSFLPFAEGITPAGEDRDPEITSIGKRQSGLEQGRGATPVERLAVHPRRITLQAGEVFSLKKLIITALDAAGKPVRHVGFIIELESPEPPILQGDKDHPELVKALRPGEAALRFSTRAPRPDGTYPAASLTVHVRR